MAPGTNRIYVLWTILLIASFLFFAGCEEEGIKIKSKSNEKTKVTTAEATITPDPASTRKRETPSITGSTKKSPAGSSVESPKEKASPAPGYTPGPEDPTLEEIVKSDPGTQMPEPKETVPTPTPSPEPVEIVPEDPIETITPKEPLETPTPSGPLAIKEPLPYDPKTGTRPWIDLVFVVDCTGSMNDEHEVVKGKITEVIDAISAGLPEPYIRYGLVVYRDIGDSFVVKKYDLTDKVEKIKESIYLLNAAGGGDRPEAVADALETAVEDLDWDTGAKSRKLIFLIGDAGPHTENPSRLSHREPAKEAKKKNIRIYTVGCSGITRHGEPEFREIAAETGGEFDYLTYKYSFTMNGGKTLTLIKAGKNILELKTGVGDEWKKGYKKLMAGGKAKPFRFTSLSYRRMKSPRADMENNLDQFLIERIKKEAEAMGVKYRN